MSFTSATRGRLDRWSPRAVAAGAAALGTVIAVPALAAEAIAVGWAAAVLAGLAAYGLLRGREDVTRPAVHGIVVTLVVLAAIYLAAVVLAIGSLPEDFGA